MSVNSNTTEYKTASVASPGTMTTATGPSWTQCQGSAVSMAYEAMMDLQSMLVKLQEYWQEMIGTQADVAAACAKTAANATRNAANYASKMLTAQSNAAACQAAMAGAEGAVGAGLNIGMNSKFKNVSEKQDSLKTLDDNIAKAPPEPSTESGDLEEDSQSKIDREKYEGRRNELLRGGDNFYDDKKAATKRSANDEHVIGTMTPKERATLNDNAREERGNVSREQNNLHSDMQRNMTCLQLAGTIVNQSITAIDKAYEAKQQTKQGEQQAIQALAQGNQQQAQQAVGDANKNKDALAAEASKSLDTLSALAQCSRPV